MIACDVFAAACVSLHAWPCAGACVCTRRRGHASRGYVWTGRHSHFAIYLVATLLTCRLGADVPGGAGPRVETLLLHQQTRERRQNLELRVSRTVVSVLHWPLPRASSCTLELKAQLNAAVANLVANCSMTHNHLMINVCWTMLLMAGTAGWCRMLCQVAN